MTRAAVAAFAVVVVLCSLCVATHADDTERRFQEALGRGDVAGLESLGGERALSRWSDDALLEAALLAVRANDFPRARRDLEAALAIVLELQQLGVGDARLARRVRTELARLGGVAGNEGQWDDVAAEHERLAPLLGAPGDPHATLEALERLVTANPSYPRATSLMVSLGRAWEREGDSERALRWLRAAFAASTTPGDRLRAHAELVRTLTRTGELSVAQQELAALARSTSPSLVAALRKDLERAELRRAIRWTMRGVLALLAAVAFVSLRRAAGSSLLAVRRLVRPPSEALFIVPLAVILVVVAYTGNPLVARAVRTIAVAGVAASWMSGAILEGRPRVTLRRMLAHAGLAIVAIVAATYLAVDDGHLINFVIETWQAGHEVG